MRMHLGRYLLLIAVGVIGCGDGGVYDDVSLTSHEGRARDTNGCAGITVYQYIQYQGASLTFCAGNYPDLRKHSGGLPFGTWNDRISSVEFLFDSQHNGTDSIDRCVDINYGRCTHVNWFDPTGDLRDLGLDDRISSMRLPYSPS